jgi:hypothetical protein
LFPKLFLDVTTIRCAIFTAALTSSHTSTMSLGKSTFGIPGIPLENEDEDEPGDHQLQAEADLLPVALETTSAQIASNAHTTQGFESHSEAAGLQVIEPLEAQTGALNTGTSFNEPGDASRSLATCLFSSTIVAFEEWQLVESPSVVHDGNLLCVAQSHMPLTCCSLSFHPSLLFKHSTICGVHAHW